MKFKVVIEPRAIIDVQEAVDFYDSRQEGLGEYFYDTLNNHIEFLKANPFFKLNIKIIIVSQLRNFLLFFCIISMKK